MPGVLFITESAVYGNIFRNGLKNKIELTIDKSYLLDNLNQFEIIIIDHQSDVNDSANKIISIKEKIGFLDIPIMVSASKAQTEDIKTLLKSGATDIIFRPFESSKIHTVIASALSAVGNIESINADLLNPFISGTIHVIESMTNEEVTRAGLFLKKNYTMFGDLTGIMDINGKINGRVAITFPTDLAIDLTAKMLGTEISELSSEDVHSAVQEITNMISGNSKKYLSETPYTFNISIPELRLGYGHRIPVAGNPPFYVALFNTLDSEFAIQLCIAVDSDKTPKANRSESKNNILV